jgi:hypothetical protein
MLSFQTYEIRATRGPGFSASPLVEGERTKVRGLELTIHCAWAKPPSSPLPGEGEATGYARAESF